MEPNTPAEKIRAAGIGGGSDDSDEEHLLWEGTYSPKDIAGPAFGLLALTVILPVVFLFVGPLRSSGIAWGILLAGLVVAWLGLGGMLMYRRLSRSYELTNQRFKHRSGILTRVSDRIELIDIDDVRIRQGPVQSIMGVGNVLVDSSDKTHPQFVLIGIENAQEIADMIDDARRAERRSRGLHIEAI